MFGVAIAADMAEARRMVKELRAEPTVAEVRRSPISSPKTKRRDFRRSSGSPPRPWD